MLKRTLYLFCLCAISWTLNAKDNSQTVTIAIADFKPYIDLDADDYGWHSKLILKHLQTQKIAVNLIFHSWTRIEQLLDSGEVCSYTWLKTQERWKKWQYSDPYITFELHLWARVDSPVVFNNINDVQKFTIGVTRGFSYGQELDDLLLKAATDESLVDEVGVRKLLAGRVDLMPAGQSVMQALLKQYFASQQNQIESKFKVSGEKLYFVCSEGYQIGTLAIHAINKALRNN